MLHKYITEDHKNKIRKSMTGIKRERIICRISVRKEMTLMGFNKYLKHLN